MRRSALSLLLLTLATAASADTVYLRNGNSFEDVIAERTDGAVRIRLPYGEIVLPGNVVVRVERSRSAWEEYLERESALMVRSAGAGDWLELARWAELEGFRSGLRQAALRAAALDPHLPGLQVLMDQLGMMYDRDSGRWLPENEYMRQRGYVRSGDRWITQEAHLARLRAAEAREARRREEVRQERIARAIEALVVAQLSRSGGEQGARGEPAPGPVVAVFPGTFFPLLVAPRARGTVAPGPRRPGVATFEDLIGRQPGSLFPVGEPRRRLVSSESRRPRN